MKACGLIKDMGDSDLQDLADLRHRLCAACISMA